MKKYSVLTIALLIGMFGNLFDGTTLIGSQDHSLTDRGAKVMGFGQSKTTHHFYLYADGGAIDVRANDPNDTVNRDAIRAHLPHITQMFASGNFDAPILVHALRVPGTSELAVLKERVSYKYLEVPGGGRVDIVTRDAAALKAVHDFLKFQILDHKTGDSANLTKRPTP